MFARRQVQSHTRLMQDELGQSLDHLRMAAAHAADGASGALAPRVDAARKAVKPRLDSGVNRAVGGMESVMMLARERSQQAQKQAQKASKKAGKKADKMGRKAKNKLTRSEPKTSRRLPLAIGGLVVAGAAVGAAAAYMRRRRDEQSWDEYGSTRTTSDTGSMLDAAKSTMDAGVDKARTMGEAAKDRASDLIGHKSTNSGPTGVGDYDKTTPMPNSRP
ncbi:hypothetical protein Dvina_53345 [Dactylosporangium vinaceum]|uniref:DUF3618 domain-containing protein n=1 Tax=Dactylosporangium vinaceum TaxID=53362 RepID=A0ABV5MQ40_9ACTN|nr:hypothetical protein [Dactylosporangium vinaceum]UAB96591.1 hypothetical protein Dvina_53345 [Dactylosporangium vinaceum]